MATLPSGTVTFVFTDIEGSTALLKRLGDDYEWLLSDHRRLMRERFGEHGGVEIDTQGDAFFFAFARARDAVAAAVDAQRVHAAHEWPDGCEVRVRMGLHTGEPAVGSEGYLGLDVVRAARLCTAGDGGHVLLSVATRALVGVSLPDGVSLFPLGERQL
jgi:class 3 adenylate cyclase